jgi:hypothetical protein
MVFPNRDLHIPLFIMPCRRYCSLPVYVHTVYGEYFLRLLQFVLKQIDFKV